MNFRLCTACRNPPNRERLKGQFNTRFIAIDLLAEDSLSFFGIMANCALKVL